MQLADQLMWRAGEAAARVREALDRDHRVIRRARVRDRVVALSFDDGPSEVHTPVVLDALAEHGARATFFVVGQEVAGREHVLRRIVEDGHELGNHTWSHPATSQISDDDLRDEIARTNAEVEAAVGQRLRLMRPPYLADALRVSRIAAEFGLERTPLGVMSRDWIETSPEAITSRVLARARPGAIVVLHDNVPRRGSKGHGDPSVTARALAQILPALRERGYRVVTVSQLLGN
jgi:peptidoglycan/xylan/chitin deacetylase (PgdA/CDA1 family)